MGETIFYVIVSGGVLASFIYLIKRGLFGAGDIGFNTDSLGGEPESLKEQRGIISEVVNNGREQRTALDEFANSASTSLELTEKQRDLFIESGKDTKSQYTSLERQRRAIEELQKRLK